jgi:hypothetical protein
MEMERLIQNLTRLVERPFGPAAAPVSRPTPRDVTVDASDAPPCVQALARALAASYYNVELGALGMFENGASSVVTSLETTLEMACQRGDIDPKWVVTHGGPGRSAFDAAKTIQLGGDGGGMSYFGVSWSRGQLAVLLVELDDPTEENLIRYFLTPAAFFDFLDGRNEEGDELPDLDALKAAG